MKYAFIREYRSEHPVGLMCKVLGASRSGYYAWMRRTPGCRAKANEELLTHIRTSHREARQVYGSPRIHHDLHRRGIRCGKNRVARLMRLHGIVAKQVKRFRTTTRVMRGAQYAPDLLQRRFAATRPHEVWTSDITYIWTHEGWLYLAIILDVYSRSIVGWATDARIDAKLVVRALGLALQRSNPTGEIILHSDRGSQYVSKPMRDSMADYRPGMVPSHALSCYDNAITESFFHTLKSESLDHQYLQSRQQAHAVLFDYIEVFYNRRRLHSALGYRAPTEALSPPLAA
jgi:putative transposase